jgi:alpha-mannosidase
MNEGSKQRLLHMIGNAHIDPVWLWQWPEGYQEVRATFASALERMAEYPEFVFTMNSVAYLAWAEEHDPELFEAIRARIADGRWQVIGGWWVEPDCNIPCGESLVRQALYGQRYLQDRFGIVATTGGNLDSFGHNASIPQLLRKSRMDSYVFLRPGPNELALPGSTFWWESNDGSRVLAYRIPHEYGSPRGDIGYHVDKALAQLPPDGDEAMVFYGVGNHGGGPTRENLESIRRLNANNRQARLECSSPRAFFDRVIRDDNIPAHRGELLHHAVGCYSAHSGVKRWNRRAENLLQRAEKWCAIAQVAAGVPYPLAELTDAWKLVLFNQFHDTLAGTAIASAYEDSRDQFGHACSLAALGFNRAVQTIARRIDIAEEPSTTPIVVFNPHPWRLRADVEFELAWLAPDGARMTDDEGAAVSVQQTRPQTAMSSARGRLVFAADLPPLGYRVYRIHPGFQERASTLLATKTTLENDSLSIEVDPATGWLSRLEDKRTGINLAASGAHAVVIDDQSDTWGHRVRAYDQVIGEFECTSVRLVEQGPVRAIIRVESRYGTSTLSEEIVLGARSRSVEIRAVLDWREQLKMLKLRIPTALEVDQATFDVPYGHVERAADGTEYPAQGWVDVSAGDAGLSVLNDGKCGHDVRRGNVGITVARSPVYAWHEPRLLDPAGTYDHLDQGRQTFRYRLVPHGGRFEARAVREAAELNQRPFALLESFHRGDLPTQSSYAEVDGDAVVMTVLKAAEDGGRDLVVRAYEVTGRSGRASIALPLVGRTVDAEFGPAEIKTFRIPADHEQPVVETDLLEWS